MNELRAVNEFAAQMDEDADAVKREMARIVNKAIQLLPKHIQNMSMRDFMGKFGGNKELVIEQDKKQKR